MATRTINTDLKLSGEKEFNDQMKAVNNNLRALRAEMGAVSSAFDDNASATDKLKAKQDNLNQQIDQQKEKIRGLTAMYEDCKSELGETDAKTDKYRTDLANAKTALNKMEAAQRQLNKELEDAEAAEKAAREIEDVGDAAKEAAPPVYKLADRLKNLAESTNEVVGAAPRAARQIAEIAKNSETLQKAASVTVSAVKATGTALAGLGMAGGGAALAITALGAIGFKTLTQYAIEAANSGNPAFATLAENLGQLEQASTTAKAALGGVLLPSLEKLSTKGAQMLEKFSAEIEAAGTDTKVIGRVMANFVKEAAEAVRDESSEFVKQGGGLVTGLAEGIVENSDEISDSIGGVLGELSSYLEDNAELIGEAAAVVVSNFGSLIFENAPNLFLAGMSMIENLLNGLDGADLGAEAFDLVSMLLGKLVEIAPKLFDAGVEFASEILKGLRGTDWLAVGEEIIGLAWAGMKSVWDEVVDWFNEKVSALHGRATIDIVYQKQYGASVDESGTPIGKHATGLDYVPYDEYPAILHRGEMVVPARLADQLRGAGINRDTQNISSGGGSQSVQVQNEIKVVFEGSLAELGRILQPVIKAEEQRRGPQLIS